MRAPGRVRSGTGAIQEWRIAAAGSGDVFVGRESEREIEEGSGGCVCMEKERDYGQGREIEAIGRLSDGVGEDTGDDV